jgi:prepilin-type N-terminal cleavage/methylation domain-containing protein
VSKTAKHEPAAAFSLIEVMVASAVLSIVMAILLGTLSTSMSLWRNTENKLAADREGRAVEQLLTQDLVNAVVVSRTNKELWPRVQDNALQFLTTKPLDYQSKEDGDVGDVCFVEYRVADDGRSLTRAFQGSKWTYDNVLSGDQGFPTPGSAGEAQLLATNLLPEPKDALRGLAVHDAANNTPFIVLNKQLLPRAPSDNAPPVAVEVNLAAADADAMANLDLLENDNYRLRNAGYFSFRVYLSQPPETQ